MDGRERGVWKSKTVKRKSEWVTQRCECATPGGLAEKNGTQAALEAENGAFGISKVEFAIQGEIEKEGAIPAWVLRESAVSGRTDSDAWILDGIERQRGTPRGSERQSEILRGPERRSATPGESDASPGPQMNKGAKKRSYWSKNWGRGRARLSCRRTDVEKLG